MTECWSLPLDGVAAPLLARLSPTGTLVQVALDHANPALDAVLDEFDADERAAQLLDAPADPGARSMRDRLEDDFALAVPLVADAAVPLETWAIPLLSALAGPAAPLVSVGLVLACKVAILALKAWAAKRLAASGGVSP